MDVFFSWLFTTRNGMFALIGIGLVFFTLLAWILEKGTRRRYHDHIVQDDPDIEAEEDESLSGMIGDMRQQLDEWDPEADDEDDESSD